MFKDHFSSVATHYARHRPSYPSALFAELAALAPGRRLAWDCGTGSGQAARGLAEHFAQVIATDASAEQIARARGPANIRFAVAPSARSGLEDGSVDLISVAQALHWFDLDSFYGEARRALAPGGLLAAWCYTLLRIAPPVDVIVDHLYHDVLGNFWPPERCHVDTRYRELEFPFGEVPVGHFQVTASWNLHELVGYLSTWSALRLCRERTGEDPLPGIERQLAVVWGPTAQRRPVIWPLHLRAGRAP